MSNLRRVQALEILVGTNAGRCDNCRDWGYPIRIVYRSKSEDAALRETEPAIRTCTQCGYTPSEGEILSIVVMYADNRRIGGFNDAA